MSDTDTMEDAGPPDLAAEYVLGTLDLAEARTAERRVAAEPAFAADVRFWEERLYPLTLLVQPVPPPAALWVRIEDSTGGAVAGATAVVASRPANDNRVGWWRSTALAALAVAAGLAVFIALRPPAAPVMLAAPQAPTMLAVLSPLAGGQPVLVAVAGPNGTILVRPSAAITVASDRDLELWALATGATKPASLGVLPAGGKAVPPGVVAGTQLLVSVEPKGGSPTGLPTGPVVYGGVLKKFE